MPRETAIHTTLWQNGAMLKNDLFQMVRAATSCKWEEFTESLNALIRERHVEFRYSAVDQPEEG